MSSSWLILLCSACMISITVAAVTPLETHAGAVCAALTKPCSKPEDCCNGCCQNNQCSECNHSPCSKHTCPPGKECYLEKVTCIQAPCNPIPACRKSDPDYDSDY